MAHTFKTVDIKGKAYVPVNERIKYFRSTPKYEGYSIETSIERLDLGSAEQPDQIMCISVIKDEKGRVIATGRAWETRDSSFINKTSFIENAETSAVGRALAFLGIGVDESIASEFEVLVALEGQKESDIDTSGYQPDHSSHEKLVENESLEGAIANLEKAHKSRPAPVKAKTPTETVIPFGKFKGKKVGEIDQIQLANWFNWLVTTDIDRGKNASWMKAVETVLGGPNA